MSGLVVRAPRPDDLAPLVAILNRYVESGHATFDEQRYEVEERRDWFESFRDTGPHRLWVAVGESGVLGYASSGRYREHPAFAQTVETSIYLAPDARGRGVGSALYRRLFESLAPEPVHRALAGIALPNPASIALHERFGFRRVGVFDEYAVKRGQRISSVWMEKALDGSW
jgi:phosphinothricin acetyltransferase